MKNSLYYLFLILLFSCKSNSNNTVTILQKTSTNDLYIRPDIYSPTRDSLKLEIPIEIIIYNKTNKDFDFIDFDFIYNKKYISTGDDFYFTTTNGTWKQRDELKLKSNDSIRLFLRTRVSYIDKDDAVKVLKRYSIERNLETFRDSIIVASYKNFRKDFPDIIKKMEKVPDSIGITTSNKEEKLFKSQRFKINW